MPENSNLRRLTYRDSIDTIVPMSSDKDTGTQIALRIMKELIAEERGRLNGPECDPELHASNTDMRIERRILWGYGDKPTSLDPTYGHCTKCERTVRREIEVADTGTPGGWVITHGAGCKCSTCPWKLDVQK